MEGELVYFNVEYLFYIVYRFFVGDPDADTDTATTTTDQAPVETPTETVPDMPGVPADGISFWDIVTLTIVIVSLILAVAIVYAIIRMSQIRGQVQQAYSVYERGGAGSVADVAAASREPQKRNERWEAILDAVHEQDPTQWRKAVKDAGALLESAVNRAGGRGDSLDERLFSLRGVDAGVLEEALRGFREWDAIESGGDEILTQQKAQEIVELYTPLLSQLGEI